MPKSAALRNKTTYKNGGAKATRDTVFVSKRPTYAMAAGKSKKG